MIWRRTLLRAWRCGLALAVCAGAVWAGERFPPHPHTLPRGVVIAHALGAVDGKPYSNSVEAFERSYRLGARYFEVDLSLTADGDLVCFHPGLEDHLGLPGPIFRTPTTEFLSRRYDGTYTPMDLQALLGRVAALPDVYLVTDIKAELRPSLEKVAELAERVAPGLGSRIIPQFYHPDQWRDVAAVEGAHGRFATTILTLYRLRLDDEEVVQAATRRGVPVVAMSRARYRPELVARLAAAGIASLVHTVNDVEEMRRLLRAGVRGFFSDRAFPGGVPPAGGGASPGAAAGEGATCSR